MEWISVKDRLPETTKIVDIYSGERITGCQYHDYPKEEGNYKHFHCLRGRYDIKVEDVTHWMPLPEPPKD